MSKKWNNLCIDTMFMKHFMAVVRFRRGLWATTTDEHVLDYINRLPPAMMFAFAGEALQNMGKEKEDLEVLELGYADSGKESF